GLGCAGKPTCLVAARRLGRSSSLGHRTRGSRQARRECPLRGVGSGSVTNIATDSSGIRRRMGSWDRCADRRVPCRAAPNKRLKLAGALVLEEAVVSCPGGHGTFVQNSCAGGRVARSLSAIR